MNTKVFFWLFVTLGVSLSLYYVLWGNNSEQSYIAVIVKDRKDKNDFMRNAQGSPFKNSKEAFTELKFFPPDPAFRIQADLVPVKNREVVLLNTNDGSQQTYLRYAWAEFDFENLHNKLLILEVLEEGPDRGKLFLAFADQTSASETYGAGRYLDVNKVPGAGTITLDFNMAYNPYCAYTSSYTCPFPPPENFLKIPIKAGEKIYK